MIESINSIKCRKFLKNFLLSYLNIKVSSHLNLYVLFSVGLTRHFAILENQFARVGAAHAKLVQLLRRAEAFCAAFDDERGDTVLRLVRIRICLRVDDQRVCVWTVSDPELVAVQDVVVAFPLGPQLHGDDIGPGA